MCSYVDSFCHCLLSVTDAALAEVLDRFLQELVPEVWRQVLVQQPIDFATAALVVERLGGAMGEVHVGLPQGTRAPPRWIWVRPRVRAKQLTPHAEVLQVNMVGVAVLVVVLVHAPATTATSQATSCSAARS